MLNLGTSSSSCRDCCMCLCNTAKCQDPVSDESSFKLNSNYPVNLLSLLTPSRSKLEDHVCNMEPHARS